jgi:glycosyltransferase involved in cell wall biosynthesis
MDRRAVKEAGVGAASRIQIALVITELEVGGAERCLVQLAVGLDRARFEPAVYSLGPRPTPERDALVRRLEAAAIPVEFLGARSPRHFFTARRRLRRLFVERPPDVVQTFLFHANVLGAAAAGAVPSTRVAAGIRVADPSRWRRWVERRACRHVDRIVCVSQSVADYCATRAGLPPSKLAVIPNGIDVDAWPAAGSLDSAAIGLPPGRRLLTYVGRLHPQKAVDQLLAAAPQILQRLPDCDLVLVGQGPLRPRLEQQAASAGLAERVHFLGWHAEPGCVLAASALLVLPSRWEGMPNVVLEAMAAALPVVSTRAEGVLELLGPLAAAQTVDRNDPPALADRIVQVATDRSLAQDLGRRNRQRVAEHFSLRAMIQTYERLYASRVG